MKKTFLLISLSILAALSFNSCKKKCVLPEGATIQFAKVTLGISSYDEKCNRICNELTTIFDSTLNQAICEDIEYFGCEYNVNANAIITTNPEGITDYWFFNDGFPDSFKEQDCCLTYKALYDIPANPVRDILYDFDMYQKIGELKFKVTPKSGTKIFKQTFQEKKVFKLEVPTITEDYATGLEYLGLPDTLYDNSASNIIVPLQKIGGGKPSIKKAWTKDANISLNEEDGSIDLSESEATKDGQLNYIYYQLVGEKQTNRIALILHKIPRPFNSKEENTKLEIKLKSEISIDSNPCGFESIAGGGGSPPNMLVWYPL